VIHSEITKPRDVTHKKAIPIGHPATPSPLVPFAIPSVPKTKLAGFISLLGVIAKRTMMMMIVVPTLTKTKYLVMNAKWRVGMQFRRPWTHRSPIIRPTIWPWVAVKVPFCGVMFERVAIGAKQRRTYAVD
jgi:hypothetical protein